MAIFEISGQAKMQVYYDIAVIQIEFIASDKNSFSASSKVMKECEDFLSEVKKMGIDASMFSLLSDSVSEEEYSDDKMVLAERSLQIKIPFDMKMINSIRSILDEKKYDATFELKFELSNEDEIYTLLMTEALLDSKRKASVFAETLGQKVVGIDFAETYSHSSYKGTMDWMEDERATMLLNNIEHSYSESNMIKAKEEIRSESIDVKWIIE